MSDQGDLENILPKRNSTDLAGVHIGPDECVLRELLQSLAKSLPQEAREGAEKRVLARFRALRQPPSRVWTYAGSAAAALALSLGWLLSRHTPESFRQPGPDSSLAAAGFVLLPYGQNDVPLEQAVIVRVQIESATGSVNADLLVGQDGIARAFRLVQ